MKTKRANLKILRDFYKYNGQNLGTFGGNVATSIDPTLYPNLPFDPKTLSAMSADLITKQGATLTGGTPATAARNKSFDTFADALNADANVVENVVGTNLEMLLATGFLPVSTNRASSPLDDTDIVSLQNNGTTQALLDLLPVRNARSYQLQISTDGGKTWTEAGISTRATRIMLPNLIPGTTYSVRARAIGGSTGASAWTAPRSIMST
jgi:Fibronectin type III domain